MSANILVTGGAGYIGSHTCKALKAAGYNPVTFDSMVYGHEWAVKWGPLVRGDILDGEALDAVFRQYAPQAVLHFAAFAYVGESVSDPEKYYRNNVVGTLSLLSAMRRASCRHIVFSSTCATYGVPQELPLREDHPQKPINPYGWTKLMMEQTLADFDHAYGIRHASLRYFNAAGADPDGEIGEDHDPETHLIPLVVYATQGRRGHVEIYGTDYDTRDGTCVRDYIHVTDLADAHILALRRIQDKDESLTVNLGTGNGQTVREVIRAVEKVSGRPTPAKEGPRRPGDPPGLYARADKACELLGWKPQFGDVETIVGTAWKWHEKHR
ncbi:UDP-glucose 4-epimerase [Fundidesulfovibrio magnetotacticus]|uniref:UDP-glucose 4-epimerase n=1 Tax=Fundidesulfovibrio magnetotacticus TaxID=2730080 RepID=A0A6V8LT55_9BACT|nr:UDP-glucose 4-epimerase GalE [Fundidesulfovibrio magnetotacticus]GFK94904.1 UDP-glucose 4-epimerase [Fundidesulfovibrio magnetotacticus]